MRNTFIEIHEKQLVQFTNKSSPSIEKIYGLLGWKHVEEVLMRDEYRSKMNKRRCTDIVKHDV